MPGLISRFSGKVRQTAQAWLMQLPEHHFLFGTILQLTLADPPLHRPAEAARVLTGIFILQHFQQGQASELVFPSTGEQARCPRRPQADLYASASDDYRF